MDEVHSFNSDVPIISVVAPVYNVEPFLQECIDSVLNQSFKDFELILVDDGSPDKCGEICDRAAKKDSRIRVFHQENGGVSSARKFGVDNAKGEWICFIDPDDRLPLDALKTLITVCDTLGYNIEDFDLIEGKHASFIIDKDTGKTLWDKLLSTNNEIVIKNGFEYAQDIASCNKGYFNTQPWRKIIRKSLFIETDACNISKDFFQGQDILYLFKLSRKIRKAIQTQKNVYEYRHNIKGVAFSRKTEYLTYSYTTLWWNAVKEIFRDMSEEWQDIPKIFIAQTFWWRFSGEKGKTWKLRSTECKPYIDILYEKKDILPVMAKLCLLMTRFPFTLIPERLFFRVYFLAKFVAKLPFRIVRKIFRIIKWW